MKRIKIKIKKDATFGAMDAIATLADISKKFFVKLDENTPCQVEFIDSDENKAEVLIQQEVKRCPHWLDEPGLFSKIISMCP